MQLSPRMRWGPRMRRLPPGTLRDPMADMPGVMNPPVHVCILTSAHPVGDVRVHHKFALAFLQEGFRVTWVGPDYRFSGSEACEENGIDYRLFRHAGGMFGRLSAAGKLYRNARPLSCVDVFYAPDPDSAMVAVRVARKNGGRVIFDIHEVYHGAMLQRWVKGPIARVAGNVLQRRISRLAPAVTWSWASAGPCWSRSGKRRRRNSSCEAVPRRISRTDDQPMSAIRAEIHSPSCTARRI